MSETFEEFRKSFSYGSRTDLSFKFLPRFDDKRGGELLRRLFDEVGDLLDDGDPSDVIDWVINAQAEAYQQRRVHPRFRYDDAPFARPAKPLAESTVALISSTGHFVEGDDPLPFGVENMTQREAQERIDDFLREAPTLSEIPIDIEPRAVRVRHGGYDVRGAEVDYNVAMPIEPLRRLYESGEIGAVHPTAYSFVGACSQLRLIKETAPGWVDDLKSRDIDVALLVPV